MPVRLSTFPLLRGTPHPTCLWEDRRSPNRSVPLRFPMRVLLCPSCNLCSWFPSLHLNPQIRRCQFSGFARIRLRSAFEVCLRSMRATISLPSRMIARMRLRLALVYAMGSPPFDDEQSHDYAAEEAKDHRAPPLGPLVPAM